MTLYKSHGGSNSFAAISIYQRKGRGDAWTAQIAFLALFVAGSIPPNQKAALEHGFKSIKELTVYCKQWGIALYRCYGGSL
jgi:hypothetical protein